MSIDMFTACMHPLPPDLYSLQNRQTCADLDSHWTHVIPLVRLIIPTSSTWLAPSWLILLFEHLHLSHNSGELDWPALFNNILPLLGPNARRRSFRGFQSFYGSNDCATYLVRGFTELIIPLQGGIRGWKRICFTIYNPNRELLKLILSEKRENSDRTRKMQFPEEEWPPISWSDFRWVFGYEGVVFPGGNIIVGRWINLLEIDSLGPFIFWQVDNFWRFLSFDIFYFKSKLLYKLGSYTARKQHRGTPRYSSSATRFELLVEFNPVSYAFELDPCLSSLSNLTLLAIISAGLDASRDLA